MADTLAAESDASALDRLIRGFQVSRMIRLVADLRLADRISPEGQIDHRDLATVCSVLPGPLLRILRALAAHGIFRVTAEGDVSHSPRSLLLRADAPRSFYYSARFWTAPGSWNAWGALDAALTGGAPHHVAWGTSRFDYLRDHDEEARVFDSFMAQFPDARHTALASSYDFSGTGLIVDVGGGNGEALRQILARFPAPRGIVFDRPDVVEAIPPSARSDGRIGIERGSFFDEVPAGADIYILMRVLHDWPDDDCIRILKAVRAAMAPVARLLIVEQILEPDPAIGNPTQYLIDIQMMAMFGEARERTEAEFGHLLDESGLAPLRLIGTNSAVSILEAVPK